MTPDVNEPYFSMVHSPSLDAASLFTFSARNQKPGVFSFFKNQDADVHRYMFNCSGNTWYHQGIDGFAPDIATAVEKMDALIRRSANPNACFVGSSMGAYAATLFGTQCNARRIIGFGTEIITNLPGGYSVDNLGWLADDSPYRNLSGLIAKSNAQVDLFVGEGSPVDIFCAAAVRDFANTRVHMVAQSGHAVAVTLKNLGLLPELVDKAVRYQKITLPNSLNANSALLEYVESYPYQFTAAGYVQFLHDYIHFYVRQLSSENSVSQYNEAFSALYKARQMKQAHALLDYYESSCGQSDDSGYKRLQLLYRQKNYAGVLAYTRVDHAAITHYFKAASAQRMGAPEIASKHYAIAMDMAIASNDKSLRKNLVNLKNHLGILDDVRGEGEGKAAHAVAPQNILLTTFPAHKSQNVGDHLITDSTLQLLRAELPDYAPTMLFRETSLDDRPKASVASILAPGFTILNDTYPTYFRLFSDMKDAPPIYPVGCSFQHIVPAQSSFDDYVHTPETLAFLQSIVAQSGPLPCRDQLIVDVLQRQGVPAVYSGDMAMYDAAHLNTPFVPPAQVRSVVFTVQHHGKYQAQSVALLQRIRDTFPDAQRYLAFHSKPGTMPLAVAAEAEALGFSVLHQYGEVGNLDRYNDMDLHIGYRLHGHIAFLRKRKPSVLLVEDARSFGLANTRGTHVGCFNALDVPTDTARADASEEAMAFVQAQLAQNWAAYAPLFAFVDATYTGFVKPYFHQLARKIAA